MVNIKLDELVRVENWAEAKRNSKGYSEIELIVDLENQFCNDIEARLSDLSKKDRSKIESNRLTHLLIAWKFAIPESTPSVIADIGGGNGYFFDWIRRFTNTQNISWKIFESPEICKAYSPHADILEILYYENSIINISQEFDLAIVSGTLQYLKSYRKVLTALQQNSKYVLLMRIPFIDSEEDEIYVQSFSDGIYGKSNASWPIRYFSRGAFIRKISESFEIVFSLEDSDENFPWNSKQLPMTTILLKHKN